MTQQTKAKTADSIGWVLLILLAVLLAARTFYL